MDQELLAKALAAVKNGQRYAFATVVSATKKGTPQKSGAKMLVLDDGSLYGTIGGGRNEQAAHKECLKAIRTKKPAMVTYDYFGHKGQSVCGGQMQVFIEPAVIQDDLIICGGGHIALPLSAMATMLNFRVTIIDSRKSFANKKRFPHVHKTIVGSHAQKLAKIPANPNTHVMIVTHGNEHDFQCLRKIIKSDFGYVGVISSKAKKVKFFNRLKKLGITPKQLKKIHIPAGLDLGAQTPEEIAVSISAELVAFKNKDHIGTDKFK